MTALAKVRRDVKVRCRRHDGFPSRIDLVFGFGCIFCPESQRTL